ncbi:MAG: amidase [Candidatus Promineifilaceae bacterium]|jgi:amidase
MSERTIKEWQEAMARGEITAVGLAEYYLERIEQIDPALNSVLELNPEAVAIAAALDVERKEKGPRGPLHGLPLMLKGNIDTADSMTTTAGSLALEGHIAAQDAFLVKRLRDAGAVILGKTNLSEWANFRSTRSSSGWSSQGGQTHNPYALDRNPCGSSSGSGVAVAADLCVAAIGTETDGSIICPAHMNGIVGLKPTVGLVSRSGIIPISHSQDTAGPMARTVADTAVVLEAMIGVDPRDEATLASKEYGTAGFELDADGLREARIGVVRNFCSVDPHADGIMEDSLNILRDLGAIVIDDANIKSDGLWKEAEQEVCYYEFKAGLNAYLRQLEPEAKVHSLADVIAFNEANQEVMMPYFGQEHFLAAQKKGPLTDDSYQKALAECRRFARDEGIDATLSRHHLDALVTLSGEPAWLTDWVNGDHHESSSWSPAAVAGYPSISMPAGYVFGLPVNISFIAGAWQERRLIRLAYAFEQATQVRQPPRYLQTVDFD